MNLLLHSLLSRENIAEDSSIGLTVNPMHAICGESSSNIHQESVYESG
jgi:hypothetical protein